MSERENFLARWSRRKQAAGQEAKEASAQEQGEETPPAQGARVGVEDSRTFGIPDPSPALGEQTERALGSGTQFPNRAHSPDLSQLPPIESITAETDISGFLAPGIPAELTCAALRRAWSADPRIRDFIGPSENSWDFNAPDAMGGFGPLEMTDELRRQILEMVGRSPDPSVEPDLTKDTAPPAKPADAAPPAEPANQAPASHAAAPTQEVAHDVPPQIEPAGDSELCGQEQRDDGTRPVLKRSHGGALPQ
jgi:hypothetical protein